MALRAGYFREVFGEDDEDDWPEGVRDGRLGLYRTLEDLLERTHWDDRLPDSLTTRQYRRAISAAVGSGAVGMTSFDKAALRDVADHLGASAPDKATNEQLREAIGSAAGFEYENTGPGTRVFNKTELKTITAVAIRRRRIKEGRS